MSEPSDKTVMQKRLHLELLRNPPPVSELTNFPMQNVSRMYDQSGNQIDLWVMLQVLTDLDRFNRGFQNIKDLFACETESKLSKNKYKYLASYSNDFYFAWNTSNYELVLRLGIKQTLEIFRFLRNYAYTAWPDDAIEYLQSMKFTRTRELQVYRGECKQFIDSEMSTGISWTLNKKIAEAYASRYPNGVVHIGVVSLDDVLLFQMDEYEIIVPRGLVKISKSINCKRK